MGVQEEIADMLKDDPSISSIDAADGESNKPEQPSGENQPQEPAEPNEPVSEQPQDPQKPQESESDEVVSFVNEVLGTEFKDRDEVKKSDLKDRLVDLETKKSYQTTKKQLAELQSQNQELQGKLNPLSHFANKDEYVRQQLLIKHPEYDPAVLTKVIRTDAEKLNPLDAVRLKMQLENGDILSSQQDVDEMIEDTYDIDLSQDFEEYPTLTQNKIKLKAKEANNVFQQLKKSVEVPDNETVNKQRQEVLDQTKKEWKPFVEKLPDKIGKIAFEKEKGKPLYEFDMDEKYVGEIVEHAEAIAEDIAKKGIGYSEKAQEALISQIKNQYVLNNLPRILESYANEVVSNMDEKTFREYHNPKSPNTAQGPKKVTTADQDQKNIEDHIMKNY